MSEADRMVHLLAFGRSMWPFIPPGTTLEVEPLGSRLPEVGDVAVGVRGGHVVAHRVVRLEPGSDGPRVITRGDAHDRDDAPWKPGELVGVARRANVLGLDLPLDGGLALAAGRWLATHPAAVRRFQRLARPAARLGRAAALLSVFAACRAGLLSPDVVELGPADERDLDRLLLLLGFDASAAASALGTTLAERLAGERALGARLAGRLAAAILPAAWLGRGPAERPLLVVHPLARGAAEPELVHRWLERGRPVPEPARPPAEWQRRLYRRIVPELARDGRS